MKCLPLRLPAVFLTLALLATGPARAGVIDYSWSVMPTDLHVGGSELKVTPTADGSITVGDTAAHVLPVGTLDVSSTTTGTPDQFTNTTVTMTGTFTDHTTGQSQVLTFVDTLNGSLSATSVGSLTLSNTFTGSPTQVLNIGGNSYTVQFSPSTDVQLPTTGFPAVHLNTIVTAQVPEPCTLALGGTAAVLCSVFARRRRAVA